MPGKFRVVFFLFSVILFVLSSEGETEAQNIGTLRGNLADSLSGESLPFANILIEGTLLGASADSKGNFIITGVPARKKLSSKNFLFGV